MWPLRACGRLDHGQSASSLQRLWLLALLPNVSSLKNPLEDLRKARFAEFPPERRPLTIETESVFVLVARTKCKLPGRARTCYGGMSNLAFRVYGLGAINLSYCYRTVYC